MVNFIRLWLLIIAVSMGTHLTKLPLWMIKVSCFIPVDSTLPIIDRKFIWISIYLQKISLSRTHLIGFIVRSSIPWSNANRRLLRSSNTSWICINSLYDSILMLKLYWFYSISFLVILPIILLLQHYLLPDLTHLVLV